MSERSALLPAEIILGEGALALLCQYSLHANRAQLRASALHARDWSTSLPLCMLMAAAVAPVVSRLHDGL